MPERIAGWPTLAVALVLLAGARGTVHAQGAPTRDPALERSFAADLSAQDPHLGEAFAAATRHLDAGRLKEAEAAFGAIAKAAPGHAPTLWRLAGLAGRRGDRDQAVSFARAALAASDVWQAKSTLAEALFLDLEKHPGDQTEIGHLVDHDSHPPPGRRIAWVSKLDVEPADLPADATHLAWTLFADRDALEREMTALANQRLAAQGAFEIPAAPAAE